MIIKGLIKSKAKKEIQIAGLTIHIDDEIYIDDNGTIREIKLRVDTWVETSYGNALFKKDSFLVFHPDGRTIKLGLLSEPFEIQLDYLNAPLFVAGDSEIVFHDNSNLNKIYLQAPVSLDGYYPGITARDQMTFWDTGHIHLAYALRSQNLIIEQDGGGTQELDTVKWLGFVYDGSNAHLYTAYLKQTSLWNELWITNTIEMNFYNRDPHDYAFVGPTQNFFSSHDMYRQGFYIDKVHKIWMHRNGKLKTFRILESHMSNFETPKMSVVSLYDTGVFKQIVPAATMTINGVVYPVNTAINFDTNGNVIN